MSGTETSADRPRVAPGVAIRLVRTEEYEEAGRVTAEAYRASYGLLSAGYDASLRDVAGRVGLGEVWVAVDDADGAILGSVWVARPNRRLSDLALPGETDFRQLAVAPEARGRGVGEALTRHVVELARRRGSHRVVMNSGPQMTGAHALYAKLGFRRLHEREGATEVEPGRFIELLAFGYDLGPEPAVAPAVPAWTLERTTWDDPRAVSLRAEMDEEVGPRYADRWPDDDAEAAERSRRSFSIDPDTIVAVVLVVAPSGEAVGHGALRDLEHDGTRDLEVKRVFVRESARGTGASRALLAELERIGAERGAPRVILQTGDRQHDAVALYEKLGYRPIPIYSPYREHDFSRTFEKTL
ncbi:GNAT family N-acetyltransferase [Microbacterium betulae]|uniref:GNAT family N-acetyltransferase n=1 Tax=Microbacterium betulae TaxID=2981139 RepID=A0AA97I5W7_9MICO|nr:GNAT family N-acetyltransferase [Microbacterium sp. AB]WOF23174.1 GNAT family N-acetyltransferase [Microbacterium sp. AB]